jgi:HEAT repeat protein
VFAAAALLGLPPRSRGAEPETPPRRTPLERALVEAPGPRVKLSRARVQETIEAILDGSRSMEKRVAAIGLAGLAKQRAMIPALAKVLGRPDNIEVKVAAVWALREIGDPAAIPVLLKVQGEAVGNNPRLRYDKTVTFPGGAEMTFIELIEDGIARLGELVLDKYLKILSASAGSYRSQSDEHVNRQRAALAVVVCVGDRDHRALQAMIDLAKAPDGAYPDDFRGTCALGLARILAKRTQEFQVVKARDKVADELTELLTGLIIRIKPSRTREYIASALNLARPVYAVTLLTRHFVDGSSEAVRLRTIEALSLLRSRESVETLVWALENEESPRLRWRAAVGLGLCKEPAVARPALEKALKDESPAVRRAAVGALGRLVPKDVVSLVAPSLKAEDAELRAEVVRALGLSGDRAARPHLLTAAKDEMAMVRAAAVAALGAHPSTESLRAILHAVRDPQPEVRRAAMEVLCKVQGPHAYRALLRLVSDPNRKIRARVKNALHLAAAKDREAFKKALVNVMGDPDHPGSADACDFARFPEDAKVVAALRKASHDKRPGVRASALRMLRQLSLK